MIKEISSYTEFNEILETNKSNIILFISKLNNIHDELNDYLIQTKLNIYTINIDEFVGLKIKYKIKEVFILAIFENKTLIFSTSNMKLVVEILKQENI